ncbi:hypothetical protein PIB30_074234 [Stylosanthes scabra]|uniref:UDP-galactose/UDP-glucose transporter 3 n=1 Tax=Stylosanthes scabra TaxID=79078 RepID=A0ABU6URX5_9FABA|nr:hypothetical protein [Stylosanthes scabra]
MEAHTAGLQRLLVLAFCVAGIWSAYIYQGVLQETLSTKRFGPNGERFEHLAFLNLAQNVVCLIWSYIMIKMFSSGSNGGAPWWSYWSAGITNTIGPAMGIEALKYPKTSAWGIMLGMNLWGTIYNMIYMFGWPHGSGFESVQFCKQYPEVAWDIFLYFCCGAVGQNFIFLTISRFGSLANTTITTTRKFVSIVVSSLLSGNPLSTKQWGCVFMVFSGLSYQIYLKWQKLYRLQKKRKTT